MYNANTYKLWFKRIICGIVALLVLVGGVMLIKSEHQVLQAFGFCLFIVGLALSYIAIMQKVPNYSFWITIIALGLAYALYAPKFFEEETVQVASNEIKENVEVKPQEEKKVEEEKAIEETKEKTQTTEKVQHKKKAREGFDFSGYPKLTGPINVIHANVFYINGRYVRLFGLDAPDNDQICSDIGGSSYNCGQEAVSWVRSWIDDNPIDCYLLEINPNGRDVAVCMWGEYDIGAGLVGAGWAIANTNETTLYKPYETKARSSMSGLWQGTFYNPSDWRKIKSEKNNFTIRRKTRKKKGSSFFNFLF